MHQGGDPQRVHLRSSPFLHSGRGPRSGCRASKPAREHVFCPKTLADGGTTTPRLDIWQNCHRTMACKVVADPGDGGADGRAEIECGKDRAILEVVGGRTILRGSFGERELAPHPMTIAPVKRERRDASVDC